MSVPFSLLGLDHGTLTSKLDVVAAEEPLEIQISHLRRGIRVHKSLSVTMRTPGNDLELAVGFLFSEGLLENIGQLEHLETSEMAENVVRMTFRDEIELKLQSLERHFYTTSSCGVCGKTSLEALRFTGRIALTASVPMIKSTVIHRMPDQLRAAQAVFEETGGLHAAALFDVAGNLLSIREDVGRHNAVDKLIGAELLASRQDFSNRILFVSGRTSFELMQKALMAGIPILASVSAPSSLAVDLARQFGATLIGFVREGRCNIYSGANRVREIPDRITSVNLERT